MTGRKLFDREGRLDPENVDRAVNPLVVHERNGNGGQVTVWSEEATRFAGTINALGGPLGGDGGWVETSSKSALTVVPSALVDAAAPTAILRPLTGPARWYNQPATTRRSTPQWYPRR